MAAGTRSAAGRRADAREGVRGEAAHPDRRSRAAPARRRGRPGRLGEADRQPGLLPRAHVDPGDRPVVLVGRRRGSRRRRPASSARCRPGSARRPVRSVRGSRRTTLPRSRSANQTLPPATTIPIGNPPTWTRVIVPRRRVDPQHLARVGGRHPDVAAADGQPERSAGRELEAEPRSARASPDRAGAAPRAEPGAPTASLPSRASGPSEPGIRPAEPAASPLRQSSATSQLGPDPSPPTCSTEASSRVPDVQQGRHLAAQVRRLR